MRLNVTIILALMLSACGSKHNADGEVTDYQTEVKLKQYIVQGKQLYTAYCSNCHQADGTGLAKLYPPLAASDYLMEDLARAACIVKNGMHEEIEVNGVIFNQMMPANQNLAPLEIAEIITYISNSWGNEAGISEVQTINGWLRKCEEGN